jgi:hypothetical protein
MNINNDTFTSIRDYAINPRFYIPATLLGLGSIGLSGFSEYMKYKRKIYPYKMIKKYFKKENKHKDKIK